ncbi:MAG TPA: RNA methyltransferase, partial [Vicinamibacteria bacterium]|nr:RNA methyltransferase [Vicinamibacteria bacterium]
MPLVRIVLVRPETAANVGACARLVRNTGAAGLDLVQPGDWRTVECWRSGWGAQEVLEEARVFPDLGSALAEAGLTVAFTGRHRPGAAAEDVREAALAIAALGREETAALVFGPETHGLSNREIALCGRSAAIPSHPGQPSYNLSHAVAIGAYEVMRARRPRGDEPPRRVTHEEKEHLLGLLRDGLRGVSA